jgi:hypothetical protein
MKRIVRNISCFIALLALATGCQKDIDMFIPDLSQGPDTVWANTVAANAPVNVLKANLMPNMFVDSFEVNNSPATIVAPSGLTCTFPAQCCVGANGQPITGKVKVQMLLIHKKGDMVAAAKPTISNGRLLVSGGEMFIGLSREGNELSLAPGKVISIKAPVPQPVTAQPMLIFRGDESNPDRFNWVTADSAGTFSQPITPIGNNYQFISQTLRWINCDYFFDTTGINHIQVSASLAPNYTNTNSVAYLVFDNLRSVLGMYGNAVTKKFQTGLVPVGQPVTLVVISKQGDNYFLGKQSFTTAPTGPGQQSVAVTPLPSSLQDIQSFLATL